jgi:hypothetical protein
MRAELRVELRSRSGELLDERRCHNAVMQAGASLVASLFSQGGTGITHMGVGASDTPETDAYSTTQLSTSAPGDPGPLTGDTTTSLSAGSILPAVVDPVQRLVRVQVRGTLPATAAVGIVREAGLISQTDAATILYNRVIFAPITKGNDHELTLFWEVTFPYGDLQGLQ